MVENGVADVPLLLLVLDLDVLLLSDVSVSHLSVVDVVLVVQQKIVDNDVVVLVVGDVEEDDVVVVIDVA